MLHVEARSARVPQGKGTAEQHNCEDSPPTRPSLAPQSHQVAWTINQWRSSLMKRPVGEQWRATEAV